MREGGCKWINSENPDVFSGVSEEIKEDFSNTVKSLAEEATDILRSCARNCTKKHMNTKSSCRLGKSCFSGARGVSQSVRCSVVDWCK